MRFWKGITHFDLLRATRIGIGSNESLDFWRYTFRRAPSLDPRVYRNDADPFWFTWRRSGGGFALLTAGLLWSTGFLAFATQARPYALELLFGSLAFVAWTWAVSRQRWSLAHSLLCGALANLILTHCFARIPANLALHGRCPAKWRPYAREL
jgi:hypothetical protein